MGGNSLPQKAAASNIHGYYIQYPQFFKQYLLWDGSSGIINFNTIQHWGASIFCQKSTNSLLLCTQVSKEEIKHITTALGDILTQNESIKYL